MTDSSEVSVLLWLRAVEGDRDVVTVRVADTVLDPVRDFAHDAEAVVDRLAEVVDVAVVLGAALTERLGVMDVGGDREPLPLQVTERVSGLETVTDRSDTESSPEALAVGVDELVPDTVRLGVLVEDVSLLSVAVLLVLSLVVDDRDCC